MSGTIRPISICVFHHAGRLLVLEGDDNGRVFHRPIGGGIEFWETSGEAVVREVREEIGAEIRDQVLLGVIENRFVFDGKTKHEIVFVYAANLVDGSLHEKDTFVGNENGIDFKVTWKPAEELLGDGCRLVPEGLDGIIRGYLASMQGAPASS